ncbi:MAG: YqhA family protein [Arcobacteraceae bacterium]|nr:YqhA family protein [Arcobacteraceae bacterium]MDY0328373.1 YqhA family protein [Arcobacteraceae bacterium]
MLERLFENALWKSRFIVILAVIFGFLGAIILFIVASLDIIGVASYVFETIITGAHPEHFHEDIVAGIIGAVDLYLIAVVMLIFSFGIYELFISKIDAACNEENENCSTILAIHSLDQLKDKIAKVIIMVLVVNYFQRVLHTSYETPLELLYFALAITALSVGLYFLGKVGKKN